MWTVELRDQIIVVGFVYQFTFFSCATQLNFFCVDRIYQRIDVTFLYLKVSNSMHAQRSPSLFGDISIKITMQKINKGNLAKC
jgi:hypothetical protein